MEEISPAKARSLLDGMQLAKEIAWEAAFHGGATRDTAYMRIADAVKDLEKLVSCSECSCPRTSGSGAEGD